MLHKISKRTRRFLAFRIPIRLWEMGRSPSSDAHEVSDSGFVVFNPTRSFEGGRIKTRTKVTLKPLDVVQLLFHCFFIIFC